MKVNVEHLNKLDVLIQTERRKLPYPFRRRVVPDVFFECKPGSSVYFTACMVERENVLQGFRYTGAFGLALNSFAVGIIEQLPMPMKRSIKTATFPLFEGVVSLKNYRFSGWERLTVKVENLTRITLPLLFRVTEGQQPNG